MKKIIVAFAAFAMVASVSATVFAFDDIDMSLNDVPEIDEAVIAEAQFVEENKAVPEVIPTFVKGDMLIYDPDEIIEQYPYGTTYTPIYRDIYYRAPSFLIDLVDRAEYDEWYNKVVQPDKENNTEPKEMYTVSFVKYFHITKEDFEQACERKKQWFEKLRDENGDDISDELHEIHNADIIYTFDNEIINNYYKR